MLIDTILKDKGNTVETISDSTTLLDAAKMLDQMLQIDPTGPTQFNEALKKMHSELMQVWHTCIPCLCESRVAAAPWDDACLRAVLASGHKQCCKTRMPYLHTFC